jgi:hypothetical protein
MQPTQQLTLHVPLYVWPLIGTLVLGWIYVLLPEKFKRRSAKPAHAYVQLAQDLDIPGPATAPAAKKAPAPAPAAKWTLELLGGLSSEQLTDVICCFWQARVCNVEVAGKDLLIHRPSTGRLFAVAQRVPSSAEKVSVEAIHALWDLTQSRQAPLGIFYGLSGFAPEAMAFAKDKHLKLLMGSDLLAEIGHLRPEQQQALLMRLTEPVRAAA